MPTDTPYEMKIQEDYRAMLRLLTTIAAPPGHHWTVGVGNPLRWFGGSIAEFTRYNASILLQREIWDDYDDRQLHAEVRLSWDELGRIGRTPLPEVRRAILWCQMGPRINFTSTSLIGARASFLAAPAIEPLFEQIRDILVPALALYRQRLAALGPPDGEASS